MMTNRASATPKTSSRVQKWKRWLDVLDDEVSAVYFYREIWKQIAQAIDSNRAIPRTHAQKGWH